MDLQTFIDNGTTSDIEPERFYKDIWDAINETGELSLARQRASEHTDTQAEADRVVQEILIEDDVQVPQHILEQLPLIVPETDLNRIGEIRLKSVETDDGFLIAKEQYQMLGLHEDGTVGVQWNTVDSIQLDVDEFKKLKRVVLGHPI